MKKDKKASTLVQFLQDVAQGVYGDSKLTYSDVNKFVQLADPQDLKQVEEFFWDWNSELTDEDEIDISELEGLIYSVIDSKNENTNTINEATGSEFGLTQLTKFNDNPLVTEILSIIKKKFKNLEVVSIDGSGDVWHLDLRFDVKTPSPQNQFTREGAKEEAYKIKYELEKEILKKFHIPSFSIRGVNVIKGKEKTYCEFTISMIYANKGNIKVNYESKINKYIKLLERIANKKVILKK